MYMVSRARHIAWRWTTAYALLAGLLLVTYALQARRTAGAFTGDLGLLVVALGLPWSLTEFHAQTVGAAVSILLVSLGLNALLMFHGVRHLAQRIYHDRLPNER